MYLFIYLSIGIYVGTIPPQIWKLSQLQLLELQYNSLSGSIPPEISNMTALKSVNLRRNSLAGKCGI